MWSGLQNPWPLNNGIIQPADTKSATAGDCKSTGESSDARVGDGDADSKLSDNVNDADDDADVDEIMRETHRCKPDEKGDNEEAEDDGDDDDSFSDLYPGEFFSVFVWDWGRVTTESCNNGAITLPHMKFYGYVGYDS